MTKETLDTLEQAASMIEATRHQLDTATQVCDCCHRTSYRNWSDFQRSESLKSIVNKLRNIIKGASHA